jgi:hypothetical protein
MMNDELKAFYFRVQRSSFSVSLCLSAFVVKLT